MNLADVERCTGCGACLASCTHGAITMKFDREGFEVPVIDAEACVGCGKCEAVCPVLHFSKQESLAYSDCQKGYAARNRHMEQRLVSSSGGIFPAIAEWILSQGGMVVGTTFDERYEAVHGIAEDDHQLQKLQGSKYLQCRADTTTFRTIKENLKKGRLVLYSGMACQVVGLKSFLGKDYPNLYTIDLICMGIPSSVVWKRYLETYFKGEEIRHVNFKEKSIGWDRFCVLIDTDKRCFREDGMSNHYMRSMFLTWNMRRSCFNCPFKRAERVSDFTLADCWGASRLVPQMHDNKGLSSVIVHSQKGHRLWCELQRKVDMKEIPIEAIAEGNSNLTTHKVPDKGREQFYRTLEKNPKEAFETLCAMREPSRLERLRARAMETFKKILSKSFWGTGSQLFHELYDYDLKFNASFRGKERLDREELKMLQIRYLWYYRKAQATRGTIWFRYYMHKLVKFSEQTGIMLYENMNIPKGLIIGHPGTVIINGCATFEGNLFLTHGVTIGRDVRGKRAGAPTFGKNVCIRCKSTVVGKIRIGDDVLIAPNTFVNFDVPSHSIVIGNPATIHHRENATEGHIGVVSDDQTNGEKAERCQ